MILKTIPSWRMFENFEFIYFIFFSRLAASLYDWVKTEHKELVGVSITEKYVSIVSILI